MRSSWRAVTRLTHKHGAVVLRYASGRYLHSASESSGGSGDAVTPYAPALSCHSPLLVSKYKTTDGSVQKADSFAWCNRAVMTISANKFEKTERKS